MFADSWVRFCGVAIVNFKHTQGVNLFILLLTLNKYFPSRFDKTFSGSLLIVSMAL